MEGQTKCQQLWSFVSRFYSKCEMRTIENEMQNKKNIGASIFPSFCIRSRMPHGEILFRCRC